MSASYASRLKEYPNKGVCGLPEVTETKRALTVKIKKLSEWMKSNTKDTEQKRIVVLTGAGISTGSGIPDFRGHNGVWTREKQTQPKKRKRRKGDGADTDSSSSSSTLGKRPREEPVMDFSKAVPNITHRAITKLVEMGIIRFCITQNVDGLHRRSGLPRAKHAVLHGCVFTEKCENCHAEHFRDTDVGGMSFQKTGRKCEMCQGDLRDTLLDWEDELPEEDFERSREECEKADLMICLGTSLRIQPAGRLPTLAKKFVIVNLQETPFDSEASLVIRGYVEEVMQGVMENLGFVDWDKDYDTPPVDRLSVAPVREHTNGVKVRKTKTEL